MKACVGEAERGLEGAEIALRLTPRHPRWYEFNLSRIVFLLERFDEAERLLRQRTWDSPVRHLKDAAWRAAALGHLGRTKEARQGAQAFVDGVRARWRGDVGAGPKEYVGWLVDQSLLRRAEDEARLRVGLEFAGLPG